MQYKVDFLIQPEGNGDLVKQNVVGLPHCDTKLVTFLVITGAVLWTWQYDQQKLFLLNTKLNININ